MGDERRGAVVLDTNVVLDWLLFDDDRVRPLANAITLGRVGWLQCPPMREELAQVLARDALAAWPGDRTAMLGCVDRHATRCAPPPRSALISSDPDDQVFIDLALAQGAGWLLTRDKALLRLARAALPRGTVVCIPEHWSMADAAQP